MISDHPIVKKIAWTSGTRRTGASMDTHREYIVEIPDYVPPFDPAVRTASLGEEIVRCRDCRWSRIHDGKSYPGNKHKEYVGKTYCIAWGDGMQGEWTNPNGYCHRGERRDA